MMEDSDASPRARRIGLVVGVAACAAMLLAGPPAGLATPAWAVAGIGVLMALWWITEAMPLAATALVPLVAFPLLGVEALEATARAYAQPLIFLFLGGFLIARAIERWALHRRLAYAVMARGGGSPRALVGSLMAATAFLSMWVSNTATAIVMLPIAQSIIAARLKDGRLDAGTAANLGPAMMLGIAYGATIGGMATLIGTPPNALLAGFLQESYGIAIGFGQWMLVGLPVVLILLPVTWLVLTRWSFPLGGGAGAAPVPEPMPPLSAPEKRAIAIVCATALLLILRPLIETALADAGLPGLALGDAGIVVAGALVLFATPAGGAPGTRLLEWSDAASLRWDVLILFGGGLALAAAIETSGLATWIGTGFRALDGLPVALLVLVAMAAVVYLGELASNTAVAAVFLPIAGAAAIGLGAPPTALVVPVALAASLGFMLPVATPPNAIVFGSGAVNAQQMLKAGAVLDVIGILIVYAVALLLVPLVFGA
jgi:sodium-dependent dicarboxylate transporter 2/3/5